MQGNEFSNEDTNAFSSQLGNLNYGNVQNGFNMDDKHLDGRKHDDIGDLLSASSMGNRMTSSEDGASINLDEFPALGSRVSNMSIGSGQSNTNGLLGGSDLPLRFPKHEDFVIQKEDFPALPGFSTGGQEQVAKNVQGMNAHLENAFPSLGQSKDANVQAVDPYGLLGLLPVVRMTNKDVSTLAIGMDLSSLGLQLNSTSQLYPTFASPYSDTPVSVRQFTLPPCYYQRLHSIKVKNLPKFQLETLFYIFYAMPKDFLQAVVAQELYVREWKYHKELKLWFKLASQADGIGNPAEAQHVYFDINTWERRLFTGNMAGVNTAGFLTEDAVRVKKEAR